MKVGWLIDAGIFEDYADELANAFTKLGHEAVSVNRPKAPFQWDDVNCSYRHG